MNAADPKDWGPEIVGVPFHPSLALKRRMLFERDADPVAIVVHYTGAGIHSRWLRDGKDASPFETAVRVYQSITPYSAHFVVGQDGEVAQTNPTKVVAQHVSSRGYGRYHRKRDLWVKDAPWWPKKWPELGTPLDLSGGVIWDSGSINKVTIGIEVAPSKTESRCIFSQKANDALKALCLQLCSRYNILYDKYHIFAHCDVHPLSRTAKNKSWDVFDGQWSFADIA